MSKGVSKAVAERVIERDRGQCVARVTHSTAQRGSRPGEQIHHRRPRGMGGTSATWVNQAANLIYLCRPCHEWIESHRVQAKEMGWLLGGRDTAATTPLRYMTQGFMYLTDEGDVVRFLAEPWASKA